MVRFGDSSLFLSSIIKSLINSPSSTGLPEASCDFVNALIDGEILQPPIDNNAKATIEIFILLIMLTCSKFDKVPKYKYEMEYSTNRFGES